MSAGRKLTHIPAIDGLRAIAIVMVILHHAVSPRTWFDGGRGGVDVFMVMSGFLISSLLVNEFDRDERISMPKFYRRRAYRLLPAFAFMLAGTVFYAVLLSVRDHHGIPSSPFRGAFYALIYASNWAWAFGAAMPIYMIHLWSLAVEEQFYFVAPVAFAAMLRRMSRASIVRVLGAVTIVGIVWRAIVVASGATAHRIDFGTDTHADGLLVGCILGVAFTSGLAPKLFASAPWKRTAGVGVLITLFLITVVDQHSWPGVATWRPAVYALVGAAALISVINQDTGAHISFLTHKVMRRVGRVSYALYLWHLPIMFFFYRETGSWPLALKAIASTAISYGLAELSWHLLEVPAQKIRDKRASRQPVRT